MEALAFIRMVAGLACSDDPDAPATSPGEDAIESMDGLIAIAREIAPSLEAALREAMAEADEALGGDSNDAEHDALHSVRGTIAALLGDESKPPEPSYNYDGSVEVPLEECLAGARKLGAEHGRGVATWAFDGNTTQETYERTLAGIRAGDPLVLDSFSPPEVYGAYTAEQLYDDLDLVYAPAQTDEIRQIAEAYEQAAQDAFWAEVERAASYQVEGGEQP